MLRKLLPSCFALLLVAGPALAGSGDCFTSYLNLNAAGIAAITVPGIVPGAYVAGTYVSGGVGGSGTCPPNAWTFTTDGIYDPTAGNAVDHRWLQSLNTPLIFDLGAPSPDVLLFPCIDHSPMSPVPYEALESTVWGSNNPNAPFPSGWTLGTLTQIYADGWVSVPAAQESDDGVTKWNFGINSFRYVAVYANGSVRITPETGDANSCGGNGYWTSNDDEIDAVARPVCGASIIQDGCHTFQEGGKTFTEYFFSVVNQSSLTPICDLHITPEGDDPGCRLVSCSHPAGWECIVRPDGGADWQAVTESDCIPAGHIKHGFDFVLDPAFCCYLVDFTGPNGQVLCQQEECFSCFSVGVQQQTWGNVKKLYR